MLDFEFRLKGISIIQHGHSLFIWKCVDYVFCKLSESQQGHVTGEKVQFYAT